MTVPPVDLQAAWTMLANDADAVLLDVRTQAEWAFVGVPDLRTVAKEPVFIEWTRYPDGAPNPDFLAEAAKHLSPAGKTLVICRSGVRSQAAAEALQGAGFADAYNVIAGFEGNHDDNGHRVGGWKSSGLPWVQQ